MSTNSLKKTVTAKAFKGKKNHNTAFIALNST